MRTAIEPFWMRRRTRAAVGAFLVLSALAISAAPIAAASPTPYNTNLVRNSGFELGSASDDGSSPVTIPYWSTTANTTVVAFGTPGFPSKREGRLIHGRHQFLTLGEPDAGGGCGQALQTVVLRSRDAQIDAGAIRVWFKARVGTSASEPDDAQLSYRFLPSASGETMDTTWTTGGTLDFTAGSQILPPGTRSIEIALHADDTDGSCAAYFDKVKLILLQA